VDLHRFSGLPAPKNLAESPRASLIELMRTTLVDEADALCLAACAKSKTAFGLLGEKKLNKIFYAGVDQWV